MPTYQYQCTECGDPLEIQQSFTDDALTVCPHCGGRLRKVFNAVGVVFKGSGFYRNDSRQTTGSGADAKSERKDAGKESAGKESATPASSKPTELSSSPTSSSGPAPAKKSGSDSAA